MIRSESSNYKLDSLDTDFTHLAEECLITRNKFVWEENPVIENKILICIIVYFGRDK